MEYDLPPDGEIRVLDRITFRFRNMLAEWNVRGIRPGEIEEAAGARIERAAAALRRLRAEARYEGHTYPGREEPEPVYFPWLPYPECEIDGLNTPASIRRILAWRDERRGADEVVSFGIGGSYLGNRVLFDAFCGEGWNELPRPPRAFPRFHFLGHNLNPLRLARIAETIRRRGSRAIEAILISKGGATTESLGEFFAFRDALARHGAEIGVTVVTGPETGLMAYAEKRDWPRFAFPVGVGGRWSVLSNPGLVTGALNGVDIEAFLAGARDMDAATRVETLSENPAYLEATLQHVAAHHHRLWIGVCMPYLDELHALAKWKVQLQAESLGKKRNLRGEEVFAGRTPLVAIGTEDMHAQTQQHIEGRHDKTITMIGVEDLGEADRPLPGGLPAIRGLPDLAGLRLGELLRFAREANEESLRRRGRLNMTILLDRLDAYTLGALMYFFMVSTAFEGALEGIDPFDQPGVEDYKEIMKARIAERGRAPADA